MVNRVDKDKCGSSGANDDGFIEASPKTAPSSDKKKVSTTGDSSKKTSKTNDSTSEEGQSSTLLVDKINMFEQQLPEEKCVLLDDESKPLEKINYTSDHDSEDEVEPVDNEMASILASKPSRVGYGTNGLLEQ
nr:hypothetical protein [Tanacetum cinerariifolium]